MMEESFSDDTAAIDHPRDTIPGSARRVARLAAVQALFQIAMTGAAPESVTSQFLSDGFATLLGGELPAEPDADLFQELVIGAFQHRTTHESLITQALKDGWTLARIDPVARAIFDVALYELTSMLHTPARVILSEHAALAYDFFDAHAPEATFVTGVLNHVARTVRAAEFSAQD